MKRVLKIFLISSSLYACKNEAEKKPVEESDTAIQQESVRDGSLSSPKTDKSDFSAALEKAEKEREVTRQITTALLSSKKEINQLQSEISDSLTKSGLIAERRTLYVKTIRELETSSDLINKELENILVTDLQNNSQKLNGIVKKMKLSEKELGSMIARLDKITGYMQLASTLIQSLVPLPQVPQVPPKTNTVKP